MSCWASGRAPCPAIIAVPFLAVWLRRVASHRRAAAAALIVAASAAVIAAAQPGTAVLAVIQLLFVGGIAAWASALNETIGDRAGEQRPVAIALFTFVLMVGASGAAPLAGLLAGAGFAVLFGGIAAMALAGWLFIVAQPRLDLGRAQRGLSRRIPRH